MHRRRRDSKVVLQLGLRRRASVDFVVVINESQVLALFVRIGFLHRHSYDRPTTKAASQEVFADGGFHWAGSSSWIWVIFVEGDRKSTRLNSSHLVISYAVFCLK